MWLINILLSFLISLLFAFLLYIKWKQKYWTRKKIPHIEAASIWGNMENPFRQKLGVKQIARDAYLEFKRRKVRHGGIYLFTKPAYIPVDPELIKNILSKDFAHFNGHGFPHNAKKDPLSAHLLNLDGDPWRNIRVKLSPVFTSGKMKTMFNTLLECGGPLLNHIDVLSERGNPLDIKEVMYLFTIDVIGSCAFGVECNSFKNPNAEFKKLGHHITTISPRNKVYNFMKFVAPPVGKIIHVRRLPLELEDFLINAIKRVLDYRKSEGVVRNDFMQLFLELEEKAKANNEECLTIQEIAAQSYVFFVGGFETSATTMAFLLHELAYHQEIQDKLREEIAETLRKHDGKLTYDGIMEMKYMDQVVNETLRMYPPLAFLNRICTKDYKLPNANVTIEEGTAILVSNLGIHWDPEYYPNPEKFDPDRFTEENKRTRPTFTFLPFGEGPRICIGQRFGLMQTKTGIALLLNHYKFLPCENGRYKLNLE
ncbi:cytochrome P450, partial [Oryctes borbonicus]